MKLKLLLAGFVALMMASLIPVFIPASLKLTGPILCPGEEAVPGTITYSDYHGSGMWLYLECVSPEGQRRDVEMFPVCLTMLGVFFLPALILVQLLALWSRRWLKEVSQAVPGSGSLLDNSTPVNLQMIGIPVAKAPPDRMDDSLADKLRQLTEAYHAGLITEAEFQDERKEILDKF